MSPVLTTMPSRGAAGSRWTFGITIRSPGLRDPRIEMLIRGDELDVSDAELGGEVDEGVLGFGGLEGEATDQIGRGRRVLEQVSGRRLGLRLGRQAPGSSAQPLVHARRPVRATTSRAAARWRPRGRARSTVATVGRFRMARLGPNLDGRSVGDELPDLIDFLVRDRDAALGSSRSPRGASRSSPRLRVAHGS